LTSPAAEPPCRCGKVERFAGRKSKTFRTVLGDLRLVRAYYHCPDCDAGFFPRDRQLGLDRSSLSPALTRMVGLVGASVSFPEGTKLIRELAGVSLSVKQVERTAERLGEEIAAEREKQPRGRASRPQTITGDSTAPVFPCARRAKGRSGNNRMAPRRAKRALRGLDGRAR
jgi:hypothetical protein